MVKTAEKQFSVWSAVVKDTTQQYILVLLPLQKKPEKQKKYDGREVSAKPLQLNPKAQRFVVIQSMLMLQNQPSDSVSFTGKEYLRGNIDKLGSAVFKTTRDDDKPALSMDSQCFLDIMERKVYQDEGNSWVAPFPFRPPDSAFQETPSNEASFSLSAKHRTENLK